MGRLPGKVKPYKLRGKQTLHQMLYHGNAFKYSIPTMAKIIGVSTVTVRTWLKDYGFIRWNKCHRISI